MRRSIQRTVAALAAAILIGVIWLLWESRPQLPPTIGSGDVEGLLGFLAWVGGVLLAAGLLFRVAGRRRAQAGVASPLRNLYHRQARRRRGHDGGYAVSAFPLIPTARQASAADRRLPAALDELPAPGAEKPAALGPEATPGKIAISVLGPLTVSGARKRGRGLRGGTRELLCYLALRPGGAHREQIIDALWPEQTPEQARNRLWRAAADARAQLGETSISRDGERYQLNRNEISIDVDQLERLLTELGSSDAGNEQLPLLEQALALFTGEPLAGSDFPWAENEQRRLHAIRIDLLERCGRALLASGDPAGALSRAEDALACEPYNETVARLAMQAEAALGLRTAVTSRYERLREILDEQLGLEPHLETRRLYRQLLGQDHEHYAQPATRS